MQLLQQRLASGSQASSSSRCKPTPCRRPCLAEAAARSRAQGSARRQLCSICRASVESPDEAEELEIDEANDTVFERVLDVNNVYPNYDDPEWIKKVSDWEEFWYDSEEWLDLDDEHDSGVPGEAAMERAKQLIEQLPSMRGRADVEQILTPRLMPNEGYEDSHRTETSWIDEQEMHRLDPNPNYGMIDFRAMAEKRRHKAIMDAEWERQQSLLSRPFSFTLRYYCDARLSGTEYDWIRETWSHEQIMDLIVGGGKFVHPEKVQVIEMNPLLGADYHNDYGVHNVPETEEFIERIGHLATEDEILHLAAGGEVELGESDFSRPHLVFEDRDHDKVYRDAPVNMWLEERRARDAADLELFDAMVDKLQQRQEERELQAEAEADPESEAAAILNMQKEAAGDGEEDSSGRPYYPLDEVMGDGFTEFMEADVDSAGSVYYDDSDELEFDALFDDDDGDDEGEGGEGEEQQEEEEQQQQQQE